MIWRLFDIFEYVDLLRKIMITKFVSVLEGSLIFNKYTFLFIYLFFCYNYSFIYLFFRNSFPSFFFFYMKAKRIIVEYLSFIWNITSVVPCRWLFSVLSLETLLLMAFPDLHPSSFSTEISPVLNFMNHTHTYIVVHFHIIFFKC